MSKLLRISSILMISIIISSMTIEPVLADRSDNDHMKSAELKSGKTIKGKVNMRNDKVDYYKLDGQEGDNPSFKLTGSSCIVVYVYDDSKLIGKFKKCRKGQKGKESKIKGDCVLKVVAVAKDEDDDYKGGGTYQIKITP